MIDQTKRVLSDAFSRVDGWWAEAPSAERRRLGDQDAMREFTRRAYLDSYWRIRETTPLILSAVRQLNAAGEREAAAFWSGHLGEELGHDSIQERDVRAMFAEVPRLSQILSRHPISPPSAALVGYFQWRIDHGDAHDLILYRMFLEAFMTSHTHHADRFEEVFGREATASVHLHRDLDVGHIEECWPYVERYLGLGALGRISWTFGFIASMLVEGQLWLLREIARDRKTTVPSS